MKSIVSLKNWLSNFEGWIKSIPQSELLHDPADDAFGFFGRDSEIKEETEPEVEPEKEPEPEIEPESDIDGIENVKLQNLSETDFCANSEKSDTVCESESETDFNTADTGIDSFEPKSDDFEKSSDEKHASENGMVPEDNEPEVDSGVIVEIKETQVSKESAVLETLEEKKWVIFENWLGKWSLT